MISFQYPWQIDHASIGEEQEAAWIAMLISSVANSNDRLKVIDLVS